MLFFVALGIHGGAVAETIPPPPFPAMEISGTQTRPPMGFVRFCKSWPTECETGEAAAPVVLTMDRWRELQSVDATVDSSIIPADDERYTGFDDLWSLAPLRGDCEDYAITKRRRLLDAGWPVSALLIAVVRRQPDGLHAVLVVRTDGGDLVLDNLSREVLPWQATSYRWIKRQSVDDPRQWVVLDGYVDEMVERLELRLGRLHPAEEANHDQ